MKIQNGPADKARQARSSSVGGEQADKSAKGQSASLATRGDRVVLSERVGNLAESIREISRVDNAMGTSEARLEELKLAIESGDYHIDPKQLAASILNSDLGIEE